MHSYEKPTKQMIRNQIRKFLPNYEKSLQLIKKDYMRTKSLQHSLLHTVKAKVLSDIERNPIYLNLDFQLYEKLIIAEIIRYIETGSFSQVKPVKTKRNKILIERIMAAYPTICILIISIILSFIFSKNEIAFINNWVLHSGDLHWEKLYRLLTYIFVSNGSWISAILLIISLIILGMPLEKYYGNIKVLNLYLFIGLVCGFYLLINPSTEGQYFSGMIHIIFGLIGVHIIQFKRIHIQRPLRERIFVYIVIAVYVAYYIVYTEFPKPLHFISLFSGIFFAFFVRRQTFQQINRQKTLIVSYTGILIVILSVFLFLKIPQFVMAEKTETFKSPIQTLQMASIKWKEREETKLASLKEKKKVNKVTELAKESEKEKQKHTEDKSKRESKKKKEEQQKEIFDQALVAFDEGDRTKAITLLNQIDTSTYLYAEAREILETIDEELYWREVNYLSYDELVRSTTNYIDSKVSFEGMIYDIVEYSNKTLFVLSTTITTNGYQNFYSDDLLIYYDGIISAAIGDTITVIGYVKGRYLDVTEKNILGNFFGEAYTFHTQGNTIVDRMPVIKMDRYY